MAGMLFIVSIPTKIQEGKMSRKPHKIQFDSSPKADQSSERQPIGEYGTFPKVSFFHGECKLIGK